MAYLGRKGASAALTSADIPDDSITASKIASGAITAADVAADMATQTELDALAYQGKPHIIPGVLYPAVAGKLLDGSTSHSGNYGTAQSDGKSYYYTDIKGSKPIKDPRIGGHFGSQRYKFTSLQLLEQETATEGKNIYSIDGREWLRAYTGNSEWISYYDQNGTYLQAPTDCTGNFIELTGYFNDINFAITTHSNRCDDIDISVNGTLSVDGSATLGGRTTVASPLGSRFVGMGSLINGGSTLSASLGTTPQINTVRYEMKTGSGEYVELHAIELIAQDTTSTANKSKIQIPSQNVVSYGKKFTVSGTPHYDPFNGFTNDTTLFSSVVDVATSLGLGTATTWGAPWDKGSNDHIRPFNGGRVVKWVDSSGTIKTSVTMMPANAQNMTTTASNEITTASATNSHTINFSDDAVEHSLSEVAKKFHIREFGNGNANGGTAGTWKDFSMQDAVGSGDSCAYVMDDGLTSAQGATVRADGDGIWIDGDNNQVYFTFIGTGFSVQMYDGGTGNIQTDWFVDGIQVQDQSATAGVQSSRELIIAQNLPYGTHIVSLKRISYAVAVYIQAVTIHQPKMPPIPDDACIIADYMLMADFIPQTTPGIQNISKGTRSVSCTRDAFFDGSGTDLSLNMASDVTYGFRLHDANNSGNFTGRLPTFCTNFVIDGLQSEAYHLINLDGVDKDSLATKDNDTGYGSYAHLTTSVTLGVHTVGHNAVASTNGNFSSYDIVTPIHTSSHYQTFETPFLHELVGGDRNIEQTNLVVTPDGKTWDEVTRDVSYIGNVVMNGSMSGSSIGATWTDAVADEWRGLVKLDRGWKDSFVWGYDRAICLKEGYYQVDFLSVCNLNDGLAEIELNDATSLSMVAAEGQSHNIGNLHHSVSINLKRGDYLKFKGYNTDWSNTSRFHIIITKI